MPNTANCDFPAIEFQSVGATEILMLLIGTSEPFSASSRSFQNFLSAFISFVGSAECMRKLSDRTSEVRGQGRFRAVVQAHWPTATTGSALHSAAQFTTSDPRTLLCSSVLIFQETVGKIREFAKAPGGLNTKSSSIPKTSTSASIGTSSSSPAPPIGSAQVLLCSSTCPPPSFCAAASSSPGLNFSPAGVSNPTRRRREEVSLLDFRSDDEQ